MIHVINRHCKFSALSANKARPSWFSRENCFKNLLRTIDESPLKEQIKLHVLFDGDKSSHFLKNYNTINFDAGTGAKSFIVAVQYALQCSRSADDIIYFLEDDYLHRPDWPKVLVEGINLNHRHYISLYDHPDKYPGLTEYKDLNYDSLKSEILVTESCHWRTVPSTTDTFALRYDLLQRTKELIMYYSTIAHHSLDYNRGLDLTNQGILLRTPMPSWSSHVTEGYNSYVIDCKALNDYI